MTSANETRMKSATPNVSTIAVSCTFHHGRPSSMSYALLSVLMIALIADEVLQIAAAIPNVRRPPGLAWVIFWICSVMIDSASGGANPPIDLNTSSTSVWIGK